MQPHPKRVATLPCEIQPALEKAQLLVLGRVYDAMRSLPIAFISKITADVVGEKILKPVSV